MNPTRQLLRTTTFRLALIYLALFGVSVAALLGFLYWTSARIFVQQTDETIGAEITGLAEQYERRGLGGLRAIVQERGRDQRQSLYLLVGPGRVPLAGNLDTWPAVATGAGGWLDFFYRRSMGARIETHPARGRHLLLAGGFELLVGRDVHQRREIEKLVTDALIWAVGLTLVLGLAGGVIMSRGVSRRLQAINRTSRDIMAGDLSRRVAVRGADDELDRLAQNLNAMLDQIERLMTGMREVTDNIAHDLRTPLNRLLGRLDVALRDESAAPQFRKTLEDMTAEVQQILATFDAVLSIARVESGATYEMASVDLSALGRDSGELYAPAAEDKGLRFDVAVEEGLAVRGERHLLQHAAANLLDNAIKYTPAGGVVTLRVRRSGTFSELEVADSGPGIPAADRERVLERFTRLEASRKSPGAGLGLSLVKAVAGLHGAALRLEDNEPGLRVVLRFG